MTEIFLIESTRLTREGFKSVLRSYSNFSVVGEANSINQALKTSVIKDATVILVEVKSNRNGFPEYFRQLLRALPEAVIIGHSDELLEPRWVKELTELGMKGYLTGNVANSELYYAVSQVASGGMYFTPAFTLSLLRFENLVTVASEYVSDLTLTDYEIEMLRLVSEGHTNRDIALRLNINPRTAEARRRRLLRKTRSRNTAALIRYAVQYGLLQPPKNP